MLMEECSRVKLFEGQPSLLSICIHSEDIVRDVLGLPASAVAAMLMLMLAQRAELMLAGAIVAEVTHLELVSFLLPATMTKRWTTERTKASTESPTWTARQGEDLWSDIANIREAEEPRIHRKFIK